MLDQFIAPTVPEDASKDKLIISPAHGSAGYLRKPAAQNGFHNLLSHQQPADLQLATKVSVVVPARNEAKNLPHVLPFIPPWVHEVLLVDGNSTDGTVEVARQLMPDIRIINQRKPGKGNALRCGFAATTGDIIVMLDADGSMNPREIIHYVSALLGGADFVKGSRFLQGGGTVDMSWLRAVGNWGLTILVRILFGGRYTDLCYGYNAFWKYILPNLHLDKNGFEIETLMNVRALKAKLKVTEIPSFEALRIHGASNLHTFRDGWRVLKTIITERLKGSKRERQPLPELALARKQIQETHYYFVPCVYNAHPDHLLMLTAKPMLTAEPVLTTK